MDEKIEEAMDAEAPDQSDATLLLAALLLSGPPELTENVRDFWTCRYNRSEDAKFFTGRELARSSHDVVSV